MQQTAWPTGASHRPLTSAPPAASDAACMRCTCRVRAECVLCSTVVWSKPWTRAGPACRCRRFLSLRARGLAPLLGGHFQRTTRATRDWGEDSGRAMARGLASGNAVIYWGYEASVDCDGPAVPFRFVVTHKPVLRIQSPYGGARPHLVPPHGSRWSARECPLARPSRQLGGKCRLSRAWF